MKKHIITVLLVITIWITMIFLTFGFNKGLLITSMCTIATGLILIWTWIVYKYFDN